MKSVGVLFGKAWDSIGAAIGSSQKKENEKMKFKILSIDGGGIKGLYSSTILEHLENKYNLKTGENIISEHTRINTSKKQWLTLIRKAKIEELFNELDELEIIKENIDIILLSWF